MIKHILKNIWTSRAGNVWILLELFVVTIFLWFSVDYISTNVVNLRRPLWFDHENVYQLGVGKLDVESELYDPAPEHTSDILEDFSFIIQRLKEHPLVEEVCYTRYYPLFAWNNHTIGMEYDTLSAECYLRLVSPPFFKVFRVQTYSGRDPEQIFGQRGGSGIICTEDLAEELFRSRTAPGKRVWIYSIEDSTTVVDVCKNQKIMDYSGYQKAVYLPILFQPEDKITLGGMPEIYFRVRKGADYKGLPDDFRREMTPKLRIGNLYLQLVEPLSDIREDMVRESRNTFNMFMAVILFFLVNIFLGVLGIFWFRTQYRKHEIGLRLALGSTRNQIQDLLMTEGVLLLILAFLPAMVVCYHLQYAEFVSSDPVPLSWGRFVLTQLITFSLLTGMLILGIWFPVRRAMNTEPAEVLHEE